jgi:hypothetical protein
MTSIRDRYASAVNTSNLKSDPKTTYSPTDVLGAYGLADRRLANGIDHHTKHPLAVPLERLFAGDDTAARDIVLRLTGIIRGKAIALRVDLTQSQTRDMARAILGWFRRPACPKCDGHGFKKIAGTTTIGNMRCRPCDATGRVQLEQLYRVEQRQLVRWVVARMELEAGLAGPAARKAIAPQLNFE